ncbi:nucleotidyltransferase domain-containing protein [Allomeiothermus silvanus]|uniref:nucleotidyltransferase domain-containing protein n=1 Tax=Allomeiothermus silvanus TaxID=52022 RepID=UPI00019E8561|nr:nucleotidyltransferase domain-containing protein [Allomeiothermus silvanus]
MRGILLTGSHARGDATQESDLDFWVLLGGVLERPFRSETLDGRWVEYHHRNLVQARERMSKNPAELYSHLDGKALYDPDGKLEELRAEAQALFAAYRLPAEERRALRYWLEGSRRKLEAALRNRDELRAAYLASTNAWKILEGPWAACHKPMPPRRRRLGPPSRPPTRRSPQGRAARPLHRRSARARPSRVGAHRVGTG